jgi:hypothetical protein
MNAVLAPPHTANSSLRLDTHNANADLPDII